MDTLIGKSIRKINEADTSFKRYLYERIDWSDRLIFIKGARGTGKTTLLLQHLKEIAVPSDEALYVSLDDLWFTNNSLVDLADQFVSLGGKYLYIDEVHKYPGWSQEIKNIYDDHKYLNLVVTSSSALQVYNQRFDLSRRALEYDLMELSLREFIKLKYGLDFFILDPEQILSDHVALSVQINKKIKPLKVFNEYCTIGAYPYFLENPDNYLQRLANTIATILESDLPAVLNIDYSSVIKLKKLLYIIASSVPYKPNISELSKRTGIARDTLLKYLDYLQQAHLILMLKNNKGGNSILTKPEKIYLHNSNLMAALTYETMNQGTIRETFIFNQLLSAGKVSYSTDVDFIFNDKYHFEIGGKNKTGKQLQGLSDAYIIADNIETGYKNKIPAWLFGFLY
jgi:predicted AAA+ superfamily ATPase